MPTIQSEVKLADIKRLLLGNVCAYYVCHNVAHLMEPEMEQAFPEFREYANRAVNGLNGYNGVAFHFLCEKKVTNFDTQVVTGIQKYMMEIDPRVVNYMFEGEQNYLSRHMMINFLGIVEDYNWTLRRLRIDTLGKILGVFPDASLSIKIEV